MKNSTSNLKSKNTSRYFLLVLLSFLFSTIFFNPQLNACEPSVCPATNPDCMNTAAVIKLVPNPLLVFLSPGVVNIPVRVNTNSGANPLCTVANCTNPATVLGGTVTVALIGPGGPFTAMVPLPMRAPGFVSGVVTVPVPIPAGLVGIYLVVGTASVNFSASSGGTPPTTTTTPAMTILATGDAEICFVEPAPGNPNLLRLDMRLLGNGLVECPSGSQGTFEYLVVNNDPNESVNLLVTASTKQEAILPAGDPDFVYSISNPDGEMIFQSLLRRIYLQMV